MMCSQQAKGKKPSEYTAIMVAELDIEGCTTCNELGKLCDYCETAMARIVELCQERYPNAEIIVAPRGDWGTILAATPHGYWRECPQSICEKVW